MIGQYYVSYLNFFNRTYMHYAKALENNFLRSYLIQKPSKYRKGNRCAIERALEGKITPNTCFLALA